MLSSKPHLGSGILAQSSQKCFVRQRLVAAFGTSMIFACTEDLREPDLPRWVPLQLDAGPIDKQEIWLRLYRARRGWFSQIRTSAVRVTAAVVDIGKSWYRLGGL